METDGSAPTAFIPVDENFADCGEPIAAGSDLFATLSDIFATVHGLFGIGYDQVSFTDADFIGEGEHYTFEYPYDFGANGEPVVTNPPAEPTEAPADPTDTPADPTDAPAEPTAAPADPTAAPADPTAAPTGSPVPVPATGTISLAILGIVAAASGAAALFSRRKDG